MIKVMIADDHVLVVESLCITLARDSEIEVVGVAYNGLEALEKCGSLKPDIILMDVKMPGINGMEAASIIKEKYPNIKVAILTSLEDGKSIITSILKGLDGYILKDTPSEKLVVLVKCIYWGFHILSGTARKLVQDEIKSGITVSSESTKCLKFNDIEMIKYISEGKSSGEIGKLMGYTSGTVKNKISQIMERVEVENRSQLIIYAIKHNLI